MKSKTIEQKIKITMLTKFLDNSQMIRNLKNKVLNLLINVNFVRSRTIEAHVQHMENFATSVKRKINLQNVVTSKKLTMFKTIRIVPNLMKKVKFLKMNLYL